MPLRHELRPARLSRIRTGAAWCLGLFFAVQPPVAEAAAAGPPVSWQESGAPVVQHYRIDQTGVAGQPRVIRQLSDGQLVVGTDRGLYLYDGRRWEEVRGHSGVHAIEPVTGGGFYLGSGSELYHLQPDGKGGYVSEPLSGGLLRDRPDSIVFSVATIDGTVFGLDGTRMIVTAPGATPYVLPLPTWCDALFELNGELVLRTATAEDPLLRYDPDTRTFVPARELLSDPPAEPFVAHGKGGDGALWLTTAAGAVFRCDGQTCARLPLQLDAGAEPLDAYLLQPLPGGWLALATRGAGVLIFDSAGRLMERRAEEFDGVRRRVYSLGADAQGGLWVGAALELLRFDGQLAATLFGEREGLIGECWAIARQDGRLYVGTDAGLFVENPARSSGAPAFIAVPQVPVVKALLPSPDGLWISAQRLLLLEPDGALRDFGPATADPNPLVRPRGRPDLLLVGSGQGLLVLERRPAGWSLRGRVPGVERPVFSMAETTRGDLWVSYGTGSLGRIQIRGPDAYDVFQYGAAEGIPNLWIHFGALGAELYLGSDRGTLKWDPASDRFVPTDDLVYYGTGEPIGFDPIFNTTTEAWVWPQTTIGNLTPRPPVEALAAMATATGHVRARSRTVLRDDAGAFWIGLPIGLLRFTPRATTGTEDAPAVVLLRRVVDLRTGEPILGGLAEDTRIVLPHEQNSIRVVAALPRFGGERFGQFQIQMLGFDEALPAASSAAVREFTNLPAGNYQLVLWASDGSGREARPLTLALTVLAPWFVRPWAFAAYVVLAVAAVAGLIRWRVSHLDRRAAELQAAVAERTAELSRQSALLREEKELFASLAAAAPVGIWRGAPDGAVVLVNAALERITGRTRGRLLQEGWLAAVHPDDRGRAEELMRSSSSGGSPVSAELRFQRPDGELRWVFVGLAPVRGANEGSGWLVGTALDVTERREVERRMMRAQRLESIGTLTGGIAHDLNNALVPIIAGLSLLDDAHTPDRSALLADIERSAKRAASMVRQLLAFARGMEGQRVPIDLVTIVTELRRIMERTFPKNITIQVEHEPNPAWVEGDPTQLHQVLLNLCVNARDALPQGGTLAVQLARLRMEGAHDAFQEPIPAGDYQVIRVRDSGTGIPPEILEHVFDPFFTTKEVDRGTGLGLSTSLGIVRSHGGFIAVETRLGAGTCFSVYLPAVAAPADAVPAAGSTPPMPDLTTNNAALILVVDDELTIRSVLQRALERMKLRAITAADGAEALRVWETRRREIRLLAVDLHMPVMDGISLLRAIRAQSREVPAIAFSGNLTEEQRLELDSLGVQRVLPKPFRYEELAAAVHAALH